eukprot:TRINITY_DN107873_c0_g1_i1.p1 TRINITY_DN107873_c0_g1~~TRINITY_DN107873_c0_g1_i1.p1  ORF type:complete len:150 (-),score=11.14 TRINITY_DN107873_c0_g1_i1:22-471(-)
MCQLSPSSNNSEYFATSSTKVMKPKPTEPEKPYFLDELVCDWGSVATFLALLNKYLLKGLVPTKQIQRQLCQYNQNDAWRQALCSNFGLIPTKKNKPKKNQLKPRFRLQPTGVAYAAHFRVDRDFWWTDAEEEQARREVRRERRRKRMN